MTHSQHQSEPELLLWKMVVNDDEKAFEKIFTLFYPALAQYAERYIDEQVVREDLVQDVFATLWEDRKRLVVSTSLRSYLMVSVRNSCLNHLKKEGVRRQYHESIYRDNVVSEQDEGDLYTLTELYEMLDKALAKLPDSYRIVFEMHRMEGKTYEEIAEKLNLSVRTVKRYKNQVVEALRGDLKDYLYLISVYMLIN
jgi:RNA polymerase sigma-70 factor (ECF subfamily)